MNPNHQHTNTTKNARTPKTPNPNPTQLKHEARISRCLKAFGKARPKHQARPKSKQQARPNTDAGVGIGLLKRDSEI